MAFRAFTPSISAAFEEDIRSRFAFQVKVPRDVAVNPGIKEIGHLTRKEPVAIDGLSAEARRPETAA
jgi:hypothetical protein